VKVSILLTTRNNPEYLKLAVDSYLNNCSVKNEIEVLLGFDDDDISFNITKQQYEKDDRVKFFILPRLGYWNNHIFVNYLADKSSGNILWLGSGKNIVLTKDYDLLLEPFADKCFVAAHTIYWKDPWAEHEIHRDMVRTCILLPIVGRKYYELIGKFSNYCRNDSWIGETVNNLFHIDPNGKQILSKMFFIIKDIQVIQNRSHGPKDKDWKCWAVPEVPEYLKKYGYCFTNECLEQAGFDAYNSKAAIEERMNDAKKIHDYLTINPDLIP
jgi:glycosyltransferase involved in cell wall biosynthesis